MPIFNTELLCQMQNTPSSHGYAISALLKGGDVVVCVCLSIYVCVFTEDQNRPGWDKYIFVNLIKSSANTWIDT